MSSYYGPTYLVDNAPDLSYRDDLPNLFRSSGICSENRSISPSRVTISTPWRTVMPYLWDKSWITAGSWTLLCSVRHTPSRPISLALCTSSSGGIMLHVEAGRVWVCKSIIIISKYQERGKNCCFSLL